MIILEEQISDDAIRYLQSVEKIGGTVSKHSKYDNLTCSEIRNPLSSNHYDRIPNPEYAGRNECIEKGLMEQTGGFSEGSYFAWSITEKGKVVLFKNKNKSEPFLSQEECDIIDNAGDTQLTSEESIEEAAERSLPTTIVSEQGRAIYLAAFEQGAKSKASEHYHYSETILPRFRNQLGPVACLVDLLGTDDVQISITDPKIKEIFDEKLEKCKKFLENIRKDV